MNNLTEEQRRRMEENRKKALERLANKNMKPQGIFAQSEPNPVRPPAVFCNPSSSYPTQQTNDITSVKKGMVSNSSVGSSVKYNGSSSSVMSFGGSSAELGVQNKSSNNFNGVKTKTSVPAPKNSAQVMQGSFVLQSRKRFMAEIGFHSKIIEIFKTIPSRMYDANEKRWNFALEDHRRLVEALKPLRDSVMISPLPRNIVNIFSNTSEKLQIPEKDLSCLDPVLLSALLPFQREGVNFGIHHGCRVLIADDMGLGKTIQAIGIAYYYKEHWPLLVVTPSSVRYSWAEAFRTWTPSIDPQEITVINSGKDHIPV